MTIWFLTIQGTQCLVVEAVHSERYDNFHALAVVQVPHVVEAVHSERYDNN